MALTSLLDVRHANKNAFLSLALRYMFTWPTFIMLSVMALQIRSFTVNEKWILRVQNALKHLNSAFSCMLPLPLPFLYVQLPQFINTTQITIRLSNVSQKCTNPYKMPEIIIPLVHWLSLHVSNDPLYMFACVLQNMTNRCCL